MEEWRPIAGCPGYDVSGHGRVRSHKRGAPYVLSTPPWGLYPAVPIREANGRTRTRPVHHLVARAFLPPPPGPIGLGRDDYQINHIDGDKLNNRADNLEWVTNAENHAHAARIGLKACGESQGASKLTRDQVVEMRARHRRGGVSQRALAREFGVSQPTVGAIVRRESWRHVP